MSQNIDNDRSTFRSLVLIALVVVLVRGVVYLADPTSGDDFASDRYLEIARNVASGQGYSLSTYGWSDEPKPTAVRGPSAVYFFAGILYLFGDNPWSIIFAQWLLDVGTSIVLFFIAIEIFQDRRVAVVTSLLFAFYLPGLIFTFQAWSEPLFTLLLAASTLSLLRALREGAPWPYALSGALLALAMMTRPVVQFYPIVIMTLIWWFQGRRLRQVIPKIAVFLFAFAVVALPWVVRNYLTFNAFIPGSTWSGRPFYEGNFVLDQPGYLRHRGSSEASVAFLKALEARFGPAPISPEKPSYARAKGINEVEYNQIAFEEGLSLVRKFPGRYVVLSGVRLMRMWFHHRFVTFLIAGGELPKSWTVAMINGSLLGLALAAFVCFRGAWLRPAFVLVPLVIYNSAIYAATIAVGRYSVPIIPYVMVFAAFSIVQLLQRWQKSWTHLNLVKHPYSKQVQKA